MSALAPAYAALVVHIILALSMVGMILMEDDRDARGGLAICFILHGIYVANLWWGGFFTVLFND